MLRGLPTFDDPNLLVGPEHFSDAGVYRVREDLALVQTTDFFPPLVDDPYTFGQIAATNSLSDVYAMGGRPITALNIVCFPDKELPIEVLAEILRGGAEKVAEAGAVIVGGHSLRDAEVKYGLAVTGVVDPRKLVTNRGARPGDRLILTKPIGSGVLTTARKKGLIDDAALAEATAVMTQLNAAASGAMVANAASAATDITGFGLIGHAFELAQASGVSLRLCASAVPLMTRVVELAEGGCLTRAHKATLEYVGGALSAEGVPASLLGALADAQTSGGLLISIAPQRAAVILETIRRAGNTSVAEIGCVEAVALHTITVEP